MSFKAEHAAQEKKKFRRLQFFRSLIAGSLTCFIALTLDTGISAAWLVAASILGTCLGGLLARRNADLIRYLFIHAALFGGTYALLTGLNLVLLAGDGVPQSRDFLVARLLDQAIVFALFYSLSFLATWFYWRSWHAVTLEGAIFASFFVWILSSHRNYHLDAPKQLSALTWQIDILQRLNAEPHHLLLLIAAVFAVGLIAYMFLSGDRPLFGGEARVRSYGAPRRLAGVTLTLSALALLALYAVAVNRRYSAEIAKGIGTEGVGQTPSGEGQSNLGFHSAIGETRQAAALVRLEGDYATNPSAPMLYLREGALSEFNGQELVTADASFDPDVPRIAPGQPYMGVVQTGKSLRQRVAYSVYLLTKHASPFAVDYPQQISLIRNPDPERFQVAYQALSLAPAVKIPADVRAIVPEAAEDFSLGEMLHFFAALASGLAEASPLDVVLRAVGSGKWDEVTRRHYLRAPGSSASRGEAARAGAARASTGSAPVPDHTGEDLRYAALSRELTAALDHPLSKASAIINFLSAKSIYTRSPGHQLPPNGDAVAPYLFAVDKRGYCVHFAHAAVYLLRLAGVPARIGTGYLTDLTYAKDGHILLHLGDRHAWPEVYVDGYGWMVFDITPARAENEQVLIPDEKMLEELMGKLDPVQELLAPDVAETPADEPLPGLEKILDQRILAGLVLCLIIGWILLKLWLRYGYRLARGERRRIRLAYVSFASLMADLGIHREAGETRREFSERLNRACGVDASAITLINELSIYRGDQQLGSDVLTDALRAPVTSYERGHSRLRRMIAFFSPTSVTRLWSW